MQQGAHTGPFDAFIRASLPAACALCATLGVLHLWCLSSAFVGDFSRAPEASPLGLKDLTFAAPLLVLWSGLWMALAWRSARVWWLWLLGVESVLWLLLLTSDHPYKMAVALSGVLAALAAGTGYQAQIRQADPDQRSVQPSCGVAFAVTSAVMSFGVILISGGTTSPSTNFGLLFVAWLLTLPLTVGAAFVVGSALSLFVGPNPSQERRKPIATAALPLAGALLAILYVVLLAHRMTEFRHSALPRFLGYLSTAVARFPTDYPCAISNDGLGKVDVSDNSSRSYSSDGIGRSLDARLPVGWTPDCGLRAPVKIRLLLFSIYADRQQHEIDKGHIILPTRAELDQFLRRLGASRQIREAKWHVAPKGEWKNPYTGGLDFDTKHQSWSADCRIGGREFTLVARAGGSLLVRPR